MNKTEKEELIAAIRKEIQSASKAQRVRLTDVFVLGPAMLYSALDRRPPPLLRLFIAVSAIGTVGYNLHNFMKTQKVLRDLQNRSIKK